MPGILGQSHTPESISNSYAPRTNSSHLEINASLKDFASVHHHSWTPCFSKSYVRSAIALFREIASCKHNFSLSNKQQIHLSVLDFEWWFSSLTSLVKLNHYLWCVFPGVTGYQKLSIPWKQPSQARLTNHKSLIMPLPSMVLWSWGIIMPVIRI